MIHDSNDDEDLPTRFSRDPQGSACPPYCRRAPLRVAAKQFDNTSQLFKHARLPIPICIPRLFRFHFPLMALELLRILGGVLVLILPGILLAGAMRIGKSRLEIFAYGSTIGLGLSAYLAMVVSHFDLRIFYPLWAVVGLLSAVWFWKCAQRPPEKSPVAVIAVLILVAATRLAVAVPMYLPNGWDPSFHMILARKIQIAQHSISDWTPFESVALNYPTGSHTLIVVLSAITGLPLHIVFKDLIPLLGVFSTSQVYLLARRATGSDLAANWSAAVYGLLAVDGSINYYNWGGLPNELGMLLLLGMLTLWLDESAGRWAWILMAILYAATILVHHHVMLASAGILAAALIWPKKASRGTLLLALLAAAVLDAFYLVPLATKITAIQRTDVLSDGEQLLKLRDQIFQFGLPVVILGVAGIGLWVIRKIRCHPLIVGGGLAMILMFIAGEYVVGAILASRGQPFSTVFTPSRFLADMNYFLAIMAGMSLAFVQRALRLPAWILSLLIPACMLCEIDYWRRAATLDDTTPVSPAISQSYINCCIWVNQHTPPSTVVMDFEPWTTYFAWRRANHTPMPISEPLEQTDPELYRAPRIMSGQIPPDSPDMEFVIIADPSQHPSSPILWRDESGLAVMLLWSANPATTQK
jgi:hypothetical protein